MQITELSNIESREMIPGYRAKLIHSKNMTLVYWDVDAGNALPEHSHPHEQVFNLLEGSFELTVDNETQLIEAGCVVVIPSNALHTGRAIKDCRIMDVFYPIREDYQ